MSCHEFFACWLINRENTPFVDVGEYGSAVHRRYVSVDLRRTPVGKFGGSLAAVPAHVLGAKVIGNLLGEPWQGLEAWVSFSDVQPELFHGSARAAHPTMVVTVATVVVVVFW